MKHIKDKLYLIADLNKRFNRNDGPAFWDMLVRKIGYSDIQYVRERQAIKYPEFIPLEAMIEDLLRDAVKGKFKPVECQLCHGSFDATKDPGIFAHRERQEGFLCRACSQKLDAWTFYHDHLK